MTYLRRAVKYFIWFAFVLCITLAIMVAFDLVEADPRVMFREGTKSIWQINRKKKTMKYLGLTECF